MPTINIGLIAAIIADLARGKVKVTAVLRTDVRSQLRFDMGQVRPALAIALRFRPRLARLQSSLLGEPNQVSGSEVAFSTPGIEFID